MSDKLKCEILHWGEEENDCRQIPVGDCANCNAAFMHMSLIGPGTFSDQLLPIDKVEAGQDLVYKTVFLDKLSEILYCVISLGHYRHLQKTFK